MFPFYFLKIFFVILLPCVVFVVLLKNSISFVKIIYTFAGQRIILFVSNIPFDQNIFISLIDP
jgi:hypothetical protein